MSNSRRNRAWGAPTSRLSAKRDAAALSRAAGKPVMLISGASGEGVPELLRALADMIAAAR
jgi:GTP-binding protein